MKNSFPQKIVDRMKNWFHLGKRFGWEIHFSEKIEKKGVAISPHWRMEIDFRTPEKVQVFQEKGVEP